MERPKIPIEIIIEITGRCRQVCPYCTGPRIPDVPLKDIKDTMDEAASLGIKAIRITGGEPLLHPEIRTILSYAKTKKFSVIINTTAENISPALMKSLIANIDVAHVSLQGYDAKSNAAYTRSKSSFLEKVQNIFLFKAYIPTLWLATVITPAKNETFARFLPLIKKINPAAWLLQRPISDTDEALKEMDIGFYRSLSLHILKTRRENINVFISNPIPMCLTGNLQIGEQTFLGAKLDEGHLRMVRRAQGYYQPSYFLETNLGTSIQKSWDHPFMLDLNRTDYLPSQCQRCPLLSTCRGGCRAMALRAHGSALTQDPLFNSDIAEKALSTPYKKSISPNPVV